MSSMISKSFTIDSDRLEKEQKSYETWLEERTENAYQIASMAKAKNLDFENTIENGKITRRLLGWHENRK
jgi:hypothetical protein